MKIYPPMRYVPVECLLAVGPMGPQKIAWTIVCTKAIQEQSSPEQSLESPNSSSLYS